MYASVFGADVREGGDHYTYALQIVHRHMLLFGIPFS
jgi:hypothetical protein